MIIILAISDSAVRLFISERGHSGGSGPQSERVTGVKSAGPGVHEQVEGSTL